MQEGNVRGCSKSEVCVCICCLQVLFCSFLHLCLTNNQLTILHQTGCESSRDLLRETSHESCSLDEMKKKEGKRTMVSN